MAISISSFTTSASWVTSAASASVTISWAAGDVIVVGAAKENGSVAFNTPTATGLTFTSRQNDGGGGGTGVAHAQVWTAKAAASGSSVTLSLGRTGTTRFGFCVWVLSGADDYSTGGVSSGESDITITPPAGGFVCTVCADWAAIAADPSGAAGTGTKTERVDFNDTSYLGVYVYDWLGVTNTSTAFGLGGYSGLSINQCAVAISEAAASGTTATPAVFASTSTVAAPTPGITALPAAFAAAATVAAPAPLITAQPAVYAAGVTIGAATPTATADVGPATYAAAVTIGAAVSTTADPTATAIASAVTVGAPTPTATADVAPTAITAAGVVAAPVAQPYQDSFNRADSSDLGANWDDIAGTMGVDGNEAYFGDAFGAGELQRHRHVGTLPGDDQFTQATFTGFATGGYSDARVMVRWSGTDFYELRVNNSGEWYLDRCTSGGDTNIASGTGLSLSFPEVWRLEASGTTTVNLRIVRDGVQVATYADTSGSRLTSGSQGGIGGYTAGGSGGVTLDDYSHGELGSVAATASPAAIATAATVAAPTPAITAAPAAFAAAVTVGAATAAATADASPGVVTATGAVGAVTPTDSVTAAPAAVSGPGTVNAPAPTADGTATAGAVAAGSTVGAPTADTGGTIASPASVAATAVVRTDFAADNKWSSIKNDFDYPATSNFATSGVAPTYIGNKVRWDTGTSDGAIKDLVDRDLTGSYVALLVEPNPSYGYLEFQITRNSGSTIVGSVYKRADTNVLNIYYNGSVRATPTWDATAMAWWRWRESGGTLHLETSPDGSVWTSRWSDSNAATTFDLTTIEVVVNGAAAVGGVAPTTGTHYAYVSKFNLLPVATVANPAAVAAASTVGAAGVAYDGAASPAAVAAAVTVIPADVAGPRTVAPAAIAASSTVPAPTALAEVTPTPAAIGAAATVPAPTAFASNKWHAIKNDFDDFLGDNFAYGGSISIASYTGNRCRFNVQAAVVGDLRDHTDRDLTGSSVLLKVEPDPDYGFIELSLTQSSGASLVASAYYRADTDLLYVFYNGSVRTSPAYNPTDHLWWRFRESSGTLYFETSPNGGDFTVLWSQAGASGTFDLTAIEVNITGGGTVGGGAPDATHWSYVSKFNLGAPTADASPNPVAATAGFPAPTALFDNTATPAAVAAPARVPLTGIGVEGDLPINAPAVAAPAVFPAPTAGGPANVTAAVIGAAAVVPAPVAEASNKWAPVTCNFDDPLGDIFNTGGTPPTFVSNEARYSMQTGVDGSLRDFTDRDLTDSHILLRALPNLTYGYIEMQLTRLSGSVLVASAYVLANDDQLRVYYNGATRATIAYDATMHAWWRWREAAGTLYFETSHDGLTWTVRWYQAGVRAEFDFTAIELVLNGGGVVGGGAPDGTHTGGFAKLNLAPTTPDRTTPPVGISAAGVVPAPAAGQFETVIPGAVGASATVLWSNSGAQVHWTLIQGLPYAFPASVPAPTVQAPANVPAGPVVAAAGFPTPSVLGSSTTVTPAAVGAAGVVPWSSSGGGVSVVLVQENPYAFNAAVLTPTVATTATPTPGPVGAQATVGAPTPQNGVTAPVAAMPSSAVVLVPVFVVAALTAAVGAASGVGGPLVSASATAAVPAVGAAAVFGTTVIPSAEAGPNPVRVVFYELERILAFREPTMLFYEE